jgi:pimeloyl-ACP methyl ester carboxylesterase
VMGWVSHLEYFWQEPSFARFLTRLASFSRLILFDKRGTGLSDQVALSDLPTLEQRMTDVQAVMDAVGSERAALLGISEGGPMCSLFAATYPERTVALVMLGTYAKRKWSEDYPWAPTEAERAEFLMRMKKDWGEAVGLEKRAPSMAADPQFRDWWATYLRMGASPGAALALTQMNAEIDVRNVLPSVRVPTLVIHRKGDALLPVEGGRYIAGLIPGAKYVELEGKDHLPFVGDQDSILDEIEEFLTGARTSDRAAHLLDRVLTTVLFILFDEMAATTSLHSRQELNELQQTYARHELAHFRGREIELTGDHLFATFDGPARAIRCALAIADAAARLGLRVKGGLHTGECEVLGPTISGATVRHGEAVARLATFGEVLISPTVKDLVAGSGIEFEPRLAPDVEVIPAGWQLFSVRRSAER